MSQAKAARWLDLLAYLLRHRYPVPRQDILEHVADYRSALERGTKPESLRRTFERDKDELRELGINIETLPLPYPVEGDEAAFGYRLQEREFYLPYLELQSGRARTDRPYPYLHRCAVTKDDVAALDRATLRVAQSGVPVLAEAAASARRKLAFDLPLPLASVERVLSRPLAGEGAQSLEVLQEAVGKRTAVRCRYYAIGRDAEEERVIEPYGLFFNWSHWYVVARARERDALRVFRVDRMRQAAAVTGADATFTVPDGFALREYVGRAPWELGESAPITARVRFRFPDSRWVQSAEVGKAVEPLLDDGGAVLEFAVREHGTFLRWLLTFRDQAEVLAPATMAAELQALRYRVAAKYGETQR